MAVDNMWCKQLPGKEKRPFSRHFQIFYLPQTDGTHHSWWHRFDAMSQKCRDPGSNRGPLDLQSNALPTELSRRRSRRVPIKRATHVSKTAKWNTKYRQVPPRFELGSLDSESRVLTITPWNLGLSEEQVSLTT